MGKKGKTVALKIKMMDKKCQTFLLLGGGAALEVGLGAGCGHGHGAGPPAGPRVVTPLLPQLVCDLPPDLGRIRVVCDNSLNLSALRRAPLTVLRTALAAFRKEV